MIGHTEVGPIDLVPRQLADAFRRGGGVRNGIDCVDSVRAALGQLCNAQESGAWHEAQCPVPEHGDNRPRLTIERRRDDGSDCQTGS